MGDLFHDTRNANTQTPNHLSSDESQSTSPEEGAHALVTSASPRINRFLAREPPDGCEKVSILSIQLIEIISLLNFFCLG